MEITEVRIKLMEDNSGSNERLQAFWRSLLTTCSSSAT